MANCATCGASWQPEESPSFSRHDHGLTPLVEFGAVLQGTADPGELCPKCREQAKLFGAAAGFGMGEWGG